MDKKHASCSNIQHNRSVQFLIQKFEGICKSIHEQIKQPKSAQANSSGSQPTMGRVAETVAKFEECLMLHGDSKMRNSCIGDPSTDSWLIELNEKIAEHVARQHKLALMEKQQGKKLAMMDQQQRKHQEQLQQEQQDLEAQSLEGHFTETFRLPIEVSKKLGLLKGNTLNIGIIEEHLNALGKNHSYFTIKSGNYQLYTCIPYIIFYLSLSFSRGRSSHACQQQLRLVAAVVEITLKTLLFSFWYHVRVQFHSIRNFLYDRSKFHVPENFIV